MIVHYQDTIPMPVEKCEEPHVEMSLSPDMTATAIDENLEADQVKLNLSFSGSDLIVVTRNARLDILFSESVAKSPTEYTNRLIHQSSNTSTATNDTYVNWNADLDVISTSRS